MSSERLQVAVRLRSLVGEEEQASGVAWEVDDHDGVQEIADVLSPQGEKPESLVSELVQSPSKASFHGPTPFVYDHTFGQSSTTKQIYEEAVKFIIEGALDGFNGTIFAYGQTGSGKTYTMIGTPQSPGIIVLALNDIFKDFTSQRRHASKRFLIRCSFLEIYNETINDLLDPAKKNLKLQDTGTDINVVGLTCSQVTSVDDALTLMEDGLKGRATGSTKMNDHSSRSHSIFTIYIETLDSKSGSVKQAQLNLVDLAGSESAKRSGTSGKRLQEGIAINSSLLCLGNAISILSKISDAKNAADGGGNSSKVAKTPRGKQRQGGGGGFGSPSSPRRRNTPTKHIPYRNSKLTHLLKTSLGGNSRTALIATISPASSNRTETKNTLRFALKAMLIQNRVQANEVTDDKSRIKQMENEIQELKRKLASQQSAGTGTVSPARERWRLAKMSVLAQTRRQKERWNVAMTAMKERTTIMKRFSQLASALQLKGQVVKEKVSARRRSVYYQGLLKKTEDAKENTSEKLQEEIDKLRVTLARTKTELNAEIRKLKEENRTLSSKHASRSQKYRLARSKIRRLVSLCEENGIKVLDCLKDDLKRDGSVAVTDDEFSSDDSDDDERGGSLVHTLSLNTLLNDRTSGTGGSAAFELPERKLSPANKAAVNDSRQVVMNIQAAMQEALSHQNAMMKRLMDTVDAVESFKVHSDDEEAAEMLLENGAVR